MQYEVAYHPLGTQERHQLDEAIRQRRRAEMEEVSRQAATVGCTFRPAIIDASDVTVKEEPLEESTQRGLSVFDRLAWQAHIREERRTLREEQKQRAEAANAKVLFRPRINKRATKDVDNLNSVPVEERLLHYGKVLELSAQLERHKKEQAEARMATCTRRRSELVVPAEHQRSQEEFEKRNAKLLYQREVRPQMALQEMIQATSFKPKVCATSTALDKARNDASLRMDRSSALYELGLQKRQEREEQRRQHETTGPGTTANRPLTNPISEEWIEQGSHRKFFQKDFVSRQELYQQAKEEEQQMVIQRLKQQKVTAPAPRVSQDMIDKQVQRLSSSRNDAENRSRPRQETSLHGPFTPQLSRGSLSVVQRMENREKDFVKRLAQLSPPATARDKTIPSENLYQSTPQRRRSGRRVPPTDGATGIADTQESASTTKGHPTYITSAEVNNFYRRQMSALQDRQERIKKHQQKQFVEDLIECTFCPRTNSTSASNNGNDVPELPVSGVEQFLLRQQEAKRLRHAQAARLARLQRGNVSARRSGSLTNVTPFTLRTQQRAALCSQDTPPLTDIGRMSPPVVASRYVLNTMEREMLDAVEETLRPPPRSSLHEESCLRDEKTILEPMDPNLPFFDGKHKQECEHSSSRPPPNAQPSAMKTGALLSSNSKRRKQVRSVSFAAEVHKSPSPDQRQYSDPYNVAALLAKMRTR